MLEIIRFDERSNWWLPNDDMNHPFLKLQIKYIKELLNSRRYIYLNRIYEQFGIEWIPGERKNICYLAEFGELHMDIEPADEQYCYLIKVYQD